MFPGLILALMSLPLIPPPPLSHWAQAAHLALLELGAAGFDDRPALLEAQRLVADLLAAVVALEDATRRAELAERLGLES